MMFQIIKNEWRFLIRSKVILGASLGFIALLIVSILLGNFQAKKQEANYKEAKDFVRQQWNDIKEMNPHGAAHYGTYVFKPSNLLNSLDEGVNGVTGNIIRVEGHVQNEMVHSEASQMQVVSKFGKLKSSLLLKYIVPLLLIFLAFHAVSVEKQSGRLKILLMQGSKPSSIIFGKALSITLYGIGLLTVVVITQSLLNFQNLDSEIIKRSALFFISYSIFYFVICGLTIFFASRWQNSTLALTSMLSIWILWTIFLPNILLSSVEDWHPLPSREQFKSAMKEDRSKGMDGHNSRDERSKAFEQEILQKYNVDTIADLPINFDGLRMQADEDFGNKVWDKHFKEIRKVLTTQKRSLQLCGIVNPYLSLQNVSMGFTLSDNLHHHDFLAQVETYRRRFIKILNDEQTFGGSKTGQWDWKASSDFYKSVPDFEYQPTALSSVFRNYLLDLGLLVFWLFFTVFLLSRASKKMPIL